MHTQSSWKYFCICRSGEPSDEYRDLSFSKSEGVETFINGTLFIQSVTQMHGGYFLCQARNEIGAGLSKLIRITVHGKIVNHLLLFISSTMHDILNICFFVRSTYFSWSKSKNQPETSVCPSK